MDDGSEIGRRLRQIRMAKGKSLAAVAGLAGISASHLSNLEHGRRSLDRRSLVEALANALEVAPSDLLSDPFPAVDPVELEARAGIEAISTVLAHNRLGQPFQDRPRPWPTVKADLDHYLGVLVAQCDYIGQTRLAPTLLEDLYATHATDPAHRRDALVGLMYVLQHTGGLAKNLGGHGIPYLASLQLRYVADELAEPAWVGVAEWRLALSSGGDRERMLAVSLRGANQLQGLPDLRAQQTYGMLHLNAAMAAASLNRSDDALAHLAEAREITKVADHTTEPGREDFLNLHFSATNWHVWRVSVGVELGEGGKVGEYAQHVDVAALPAAERRGMFYGDLARGLAQDRSTRARAATALRTAEKIAPQRVRTNPYIRETLVNLIYQAKGDAVGRDLRGIAHRAGLPV